MKKIFILAIFTCFTMHSSETKPTLEYAQLFTCEWTEENFNKVNAAQKAKIIFSFRTCTTSNLIRFEAKETSIPRIGLKKNPDPVSCVSPS